MGIDRYADVRIVVYILSRAFLSNWIRQNNVEELYSLLKFLRIRPLNNWETFNNQINKPVKSGKSVRAMKRLQVSSHSPPLYCISLRRIPGRSESGHAEKEEGRYTERETTTRAHR